MSALVVGEAVLDVVSAHGCAPVSRPGGSAVNTAVALARLGRPVRLLTAIGDDEGGRLIGAHLASAAVVPVLSPGAIARTAVAEALIGADGAAEYRLDVEWRLPGLAGLSVLEPAPGEATPRVLHVTSFAPVLRPGAEQVLALVQAWRSRLTVSYDLNLRPGVTGTGPHLLRAVEQMVGHSDLVKASDEDLARLWPDLGVDAAARRLLDAGAEAVVVTRGAEGASWHTKDAGPGSTGLVPAVPVDVVDTIGAGDTFSAGLLDSLWDHLGEPGASLATLGDDVWHDALAHAVRAAAVTVSRQGADPPYAVDLA